MTIIKRYFLFICGLFFVAFGISCGVKSMIGTSPISSIPYIFSMQYSTSLGMFVFSVNMLFLLGQILILQRQFQYIQFLQIPMTVIFSLFIDLTMFLLDSVPLGSYISELCITLLGSCSLALGVALEVIAHVIVLPAEGIVTAIVTRWKFNFGHTKTMFDMSLVLIAILFSLLYFDEILGIREGTLISALITGSIANFYIKHLSYIDKRGELIFHLPFTKLPAELIRKHNDLSNK